MIDHVSVPVRDLAAGAAFYSHVLAPLGYAKLVERPASIGFGKRYPEFWLNLRADLPPPSADPGSHICLRAPSHAAERACHAQALAECWADDAEPGPRRSAVP